MRIFRSLGLAFVIAAGFLPTLPFTARAQLVADIRAELPPPPLPIYDQPPIPAPGYIWTPGYWAWDGYDYYWVPGTWVLAPQPGLLWTPGYWTWQDGVYLFQAGYWGPQVGFYGGIDYGFGYAGVGYEGGYWNNGAFFYNRAVNNITNVNITNVYVKNVVVNRTTTVSYNGGPGGIVARPTPEQQLAAARETHIPPTPAQRQHVEAASKDRSLFASTNHGAPPVAATASPGALNGPGVVPAKAAGSAPPHPEQHALPIPGEHGLPMPAPQAEHPQPMPHPAPPTEHALPVPPPQPEHPQAAPHAPPAAEHEMPMRPQQMERPQPAPHPMAPQVERPPAPHPPAPQAEHPRPKPERGQPRREE
jgi:WXXGXW repeat (2 copies)